MKRVFVLFLAAMMALSLFGCGKALPTEAKLGETLKSDLVEVTLTDFGFAEEGVSVDEEKPDILGTPVPFPYALTGNEVMDNLTLQLSESKYIRKTEAQSVVYLEYTVKVHAKETVTQSITPFIRFNDSEGYNLTGVSPVAMSSIMPDPAEGVTCRQDGDGWEYMPLFWAPDGEYLCRGVAKVSAEVEQNTDAPLTVSFSLPNSDGTTESYTFIIR